MNTTKRRHFPRHPAVVRVVLAATAALLGGSSSLATSDAASGIAAYPPPAKHVLVINIENKGYDTTWGAGSATPYQAKTLRGKGMLLKTYYGTAHNSQPTYVAQISGQGPNPQIESDCQIYSAFAGIGTVAPSQAVGNGCVFPASLPTIANQLSAAGLSWKGYMEDMGTACRHPVVGTQDPTQTAHVGDQYAVHHNPFMSFTSVTGSADCATHVVDLSKLKAGLPAPLPRVRRLDRAPPLRPRRLQQRWNAG